MRLAITLHDDGQREQVDAREYVLREADVLAVVREVVQEAIDVHVRSGIHEGSGVAVEFEVVALAGGELRDLLRVGFPVYFRIYLACQSLVDLIG